MALCTPAKEWMGPHARSRDTCTRKTTTVHRAHVAGSALHRRLRPRPRPHHHRHRHHLQQATPASRAWATSRRASTSTTTSSVPPGAWAAADWSVTCAACAKLRPPRQAFHGCRVPVRLGGPCTRWRWGKAMAAVLRCPRLHSRPGLPSPLPPPRPCWAWQACALLGRGRLSLPLKKRTHWFSILRKVWSGNLEPGCGTRGPRPRTRRGCLWCGPHSLLIQRIPPPLSPHFPFPTALGRLAACCQMHVAYR
mmetsp:Transcript_89726/g.155353  ORF Transcript_89726/g.155353 Transcript_89726/m.155353 type:complete len:251 (+) Transcript_89726:206-958(+)